MPRGRKRTGAAWRRKMSDGTYRWYARPILADGSPGKAQMLPASITTKARAKEVAMAWTEQATKDGKVAAPAADDGKPADSTIASLVKAWVPLLQSGDRSPATKKDYAKAVGRASQRFGTVRIEELTTGMLLGWVRELKAELSASKVRETINTFAVMIDDAAAEDWIGCANPARHKKVREALPKVEHPDADDIAVLTEEQASKLLRTKADAVWWLRELIGATTGMRDQEIAGLRWDRIVEENGVRLFYIKDVIAIHGEDGYASSKTTKNRSSKRKVPIHSLAWKHLEAWRAEGWQKYVGRKPKDEDYILTNAKGEAHRPRSAQLLRDHLEAAGLPTQFKGADLEFKCWRASVNSWLRSHGVDRETRERILGHSRSSVNERHYTGADYARLRDAIETIRLDLDDPQPVATNSTTNSTDEPEIAQLQSHLRDLNSRPTVYECAVAPLDAPASAHIGAESKIAQPQTSAANQSNPRSVELNVELKDSDLEYLAKRAADDRQWDIVARIASLLEQRRAEREAARPSAPVFQLKRPPTNAR